MTTINLKSLSTAERKEFLIREFKSGQIASVEWDTAKSGRTTRSIKLWVERALASGDKEIVQPATNKNVNHLNVVDMAKLSNGIEYPWATINVDTLVQVKIKGNVYTF